MPYSIQSTVNELLASDRAKAVIDAYVPGASSHPQIALVGEMRLVAVAKLFEALLPQGALDRIDAELRAV